MMGRAAENYGEIDGALSLGPNCFLLSALIIIIWVLVAMPVFAESILQGGAYQTDLGISVQHFKWTEHGQDGLRLVEETGMLYGLTQALAYRKGIFGWRQGAALFFGEVDYDGYTWGLEPIQTDAVYIGADAFFDLEPAYQWSSGFMVKGFGGLGGRLWLRDLDGTRTELGTRVAGVEEWWWSIYGRAGVGLAFPLGSFGRISAESGVKLPIYSRNEANFFVPGSDSVDLEPEMRVSPFVKVGWQWKSIRVQAFYDTFRFNPSDRVKSGNYEIYQPESDADMIGLEGSWVLYF